MQDSTLLVGVLEDDMLGGNVFSKDLTETKGGSLVRDSDTEETLSKVTHLN
jgi:hypothetical protein